MSLLGNNYELRTTNFTTSFYNNFTKIEQINSQLHTSNVFSTLRRKRDQEFFKRTQQLSQHWFYKKYLQHYFLLISKNWVFKKKQQIQTYFSYLMYFTLVQGNNRYSVSIIKENISTIIFTSRGAGIQA